MTTAFKSQPGKDRSDYTNPISSAKLVTIKPRKISAVLFDMDGIVTKTATVHAAAWKTTFDEFLKHRDPKSKQFDIKSDYQKYVDGKPRYDGVKSFLKSRHIDLPWGSKDDSPGFDTVCAIGNKKNDEFHKQLSEGSVEVYETTVALIQSLKAAGIKVGVVTASENGVAILKAANLLHIFDAKVDGVDAIKQNLKGKPAPDTFLEAAHRLGVAKERAVVIEDAEAGVEAGHNGGFGMVIGVDRNGHSQTLKEHGATHVVHDLGEVGLPGEYAKLPGMAIADLQISDKNWVLLYDHFDPQREGSRESLCSMGNGYLTVRAAASESTRDSIHAPGSYLAGVYNRLLTRDGDLEIESEDLVNIPNWQFLSFKIDDGPWFNLSEVELTQFKQFFNLKEGVLYRQIRFKDQQGRESILFEKRFVHMRRCHIAAIQTELLAKNWTGKVTVKSAIDGKVINIGTKLYERMEKKHLSCVESSADSSMLFLKATTSQSQINIAEAVQTRAFVNGIAVKEEWTASQSPDYVFHEVTIDLEEGSTLTVQKTAAIYCSRDNAISECGAAAKEAVSDAPSFEKLLEEQIESWRHLWSHFDLSLETAESIKMQISLILHLHSLHVLATASPNSVDLDMGMPARGWSEGYQGHVFWDDLYVFPFLNLRMPEITQSLIKYRYRRLSAARQIAKQRGVGGACFPWQSGSSGREETAAYLWYPKIKEWKRDDSHLQIHVNGAIVVNIWQYYQATGNLGFMYACGAELLFEIARFFADTAQYNKERDRYEIHGVVGPDEYHVAYPDAKEPGLNNNAYTNILAVWTLCKALELLNILPQDRCHEISERLKLSSDELAKWEEISRKMFVPFQENGIINQFEGYEQLQEFPHKKDGVVVVEDVARMLEDKGGVLNEYKISKQPDVLMLFYLFSAEEISELFHRLGYEYKFDTIPKNIYYYAPRTSNYSTLSRVALTWVLSRADRGHAWELLSSMSKDAKTPRSNAKQKTHPRLWDIFREALDSDFMDIQGGTTREGIHIGAMAGTIDIVQRCYTGIVTTGDVLWFNPGLPEEMTRLSLRLQYRHQMLIVEITQKHTTISAGYASTHPIRIGFKNKCYEFQAGDTWRFDIETGEGCKLEKSEHTMPPARI